MANLILVSFLTFSFCLSLWAKVDRIYTEGYLGEKRIEFYSDRYSPIIFQDIYRGKMSFEDELFYQNFFDPYLFNDEKEFTFFLNSELNGGMVCSNEKFSDHFDEIRFSYRLITLSYLLEGQWHLQLLNDHFKLKAVDFDLSKWIQGCKPKSSDMKRFLERLRKYSPKYQDTLPKDYSKVSWWRDFRKHDFKYYSHYRLKSFCQDKCTEDEMENHFKGMAQKNLNLMELICSEEDEIYGLSSFRDAYYLIGQSNIVNTFNKSGEADGCLRRFSEVMSHKEVSYEALQQLFPSIQSYLRQKYQDRFLQGRVFFFGASKEFEEKGLKNLYIVEKPILIGELPPEEKIVEVVTPAILPKKEEIKKASEPKVVELPKPKEKEMTKPMKSAFLLAAETRRASGLDRIEVDMIKLKYDYVFSLNMINNLSQKLGTFMTREALVEMGQYDKLGTKEGPVPLLFLKYMIDMQEHQGLYNLVAVLGERFYVSNEIDSNFRPALEFIQLVNNDSTGRQWQIIILKP